MNKGIKQEGWQFKELCQQGFRDIRKERDELLKFISKMTISCPECCATKSSYDEPPYFHCSQCGYEIEKEDDELD